MITVVDYGAGNLRSVQNTLEELGAAYLVTNQAREIDRADRIILPGVGHFGQMATALDDLGVREPLVRKIKSGAPFLGICVGLQYLFDASEESPGASGLGVLPGTIKRFQGSMRVPHMGWNSLEARRPSRLLTGFDGLIYTYFAHSFYAPVIEATAAICTYSHPYSAVIEQGNLFAVQFHPEKSGPAGLRVLQNFIEL
ncbi:MAG TPA: imidazole glycerol phosphate synthase subunit HisH [Bryobacteraceae bacterium]|nr:imidazole glycerol phosphate synthase subunit HisH [Bryobacteraceae bacterium]